MCFKNTYITTSKGKNTSASQSIHILSYVFIYIWVSHLKNWLTDGKKLHYFFSCFLKDQMQRCITSLSQWIILIVVLKSDVVLLWLHYKRLFCYLSIFNFQWHLKEILFFSFFKSTFLTKWKWKEDLHYVGFV